MQKDSYGNIPLHWASDRGQYEALEYLLSQIPEYQKHEENRQQQQDNEEQQLESTIVNTRGYLGNTPLARACRGGRIFCVELLLARDDIDPNICNDKKQYPLHFAAFKKHPEVVRLMLESGKCSTLVKDRKGRTPAEDTSVEEIKRMILEHRERNSQ